MDMQKHVKPLLLGATYTAALLLFGSLVMGATRANPRRNSRKYDKMHAYKWRVTYWGPESTGKGKREDFETLRDAKNALRGMARASGLDLSELELQGNSDDLVYCDIDNGGKIGSSRRGRHA